VPWEVQLQVALGMRWATEFPAGCGYKAVFLFRRLLSALSSLRTTPRVTNPQKCVYSEDEPASGHTSQPIRWLALSTI
jgi:hypothetical protein